MYGRDTTRTQVYRDALGATVAWWVRTADRPAADLCEIGRTPEGCLWVLIADISCVGDRSNAVRQALMDALTESHLEPSAFLLRANRRVIDSRGDSDCFATCLYGVYDPDTAAFSFANAGHPDPTITPDNDQAARWQEIRGLPLGWEVDASYCTMRTHIEEDSLIAFYTNGVTDQGNGNAARYGRSRLETLAHEAPGAVSLASNVLSDLESFAQGKSPDDHAAFVALFVHPIHRIVFPSDLALVSDQCEQVCDHVAASRPALEDDRYNLHLCLDEAISNAIRHGSGGNLERLVTVSYSVNSEYVQVAVREQGHTEVPDQGMVSIQGADLDAPGGRGLLLISQLVDRWRWDATRKEFFMLLPIHSEAAVTA